MRVVNRHAAEILDVVAVDDRDGIVDRVVLLEAWIREEPRACRVGRIREIRIHVDHQVADADAGDVAVEDVDAARVVLLAIVREQHAEAIGERVAEFEGVGVEFRVQLVVGSAPILAARHDLLRNADDGVAQRIHRISAGRDRGADLDHRAAEHRGRCRLQTVDAAVDQAEEMIDAGGGTNLLHADAVGLHAGANRIGVEDGRARAADVGGRLVVEDDVAKALKLIAVFITEIDHRAVVLERLPAHRARVAAEVRASALPRCFVLGADGVEPHRYTCRAQWLVHVERGALAAPVVIADLRGDLALRLGALGRDVDDAADVDVAEGESAGAAGELDPLGVVDVLRHVPREAVAELANRRESAETDLVARTRADGGAAGAGVVEEVLGVGREFDRIEEIVDGDVLEKLLRHHRDRVGQVFEFLVGARAGQGGCGGVAEIFFRRDLEDRQLDGGFGAGLGGWRGRDGLSGRR